MFFKDDPTAPVIPGIDSIFTMLKSNVGYGLLAILLGLLVFVVVFKLQPIMDFFKERAQKKHDLEIKKMETDTQNKDRTFQFQESLLKSIEKVPEAFDKVISAVSGSEMRIIAKVDDMEEKVMDKVDRVMDRLTNK